MMKWKRNKNVEIYKLGKSLWEFKIVRYSSLKENIEILKMLFFKEVGFKIKTNIQHFMI